MNVHNKTYYFVNLIYLILFKEKKTKTNKTFIKFKINRKKYEISKLNSNIGLNKRKELYSKELYFVLIRPKANPAVISKKSCPIWPD